MKKQHKIVAVGAGITLVIIIVMSFILFQPKIGEKGDVQASAAEAVVKKQVPAPVKSENNTSKAKDKLPGENKEKGVDLEALTLFTADDNTFEKKELEKVEADKNLSIEKKLALIANELSEKQFDSLPIEIQEVKKIDGKTIAVINLKEKKGKGDKTWIQYLNAGSTGSAITRVTFEESFLQRELKSKWVDGIKIIHEGKDMEEMDHFPGTQIIYRNK